ncbi:MAG: hypothetical protein JSS81_17635 [Acidobacteria bacterium]|nr:hypothetical protein [Acidobacteriota bacterium]
MKNILPIIAVIFVFGSIGLAQKKTEVVVLATLHQFHADNQGYSFDVLSRTIERIRPDVVAVELTPKDLESRREQKVKIEYARSVFPMIDKHKYKTVALEPDEPLYSELIGLLKESNKEAQEKFPQKTEAFSIYSDVLYAYLFKRWTSVAAVNSKETDALFEVKHDYQNALFGAREAKVWNDWNAHFLARILDAAASNKGKRILVTVGAEHAYWLRRELAKESAVRLREVADFL